MFKNNRLTQPVFIGVILSVLIAIIAFGATRVSAAEMKQIDQSTTSATIQWDNAPDDIECYYIGWGADFKEAKKMVDSKKKKLDAGFSSYVIKDLKAGTKYVVYVSYKVKTSGVIQPLIEDGVVHTGPSKVSGVSVLNVNNIQKTVTYTWKTQEGVSGYQYVLKNANGGDIKKDIIPSGTESVIQLEIKTNDIYRFQVRAYSDRFGKTVYGAWSTATYFAAQPELTKGIANAKGLSLKWTNFKSADSYTVYVSDAPTKGYKKVGTTSKNTFSLSKLNGSKISKNKSYYVYIIANKKVNGKTYKSTKNMYTVIKGGIVDSHIFE